MGGILGETLLKMLMGLFMGDYPETERITRHSGVDR